MQNQKIINGIYLQELLRDNFTKKIQKKESIDYDTMDMIRMLCFELGWRNGDRQEYYAQQDVSEFYDFLINILNPTQFMIEIKRYTYEDISQDKCGSIEKIPFIPLSPPNTNSVNPSNKSSIGNNIGINNMLDNWMFDNMLTLNNKKTIINNYNIVNVPYLLPLVINRFTCENNRLNIDINIDKIISPFKHENKTLFWNIHAIICHNGNSIRIRTLLCFVM